MTRRPMAPRSAIRSLAPHVRVEPGDGRSWTSARIGMGPWPARITLDESLMRIEAVIPGVDPMFDCASALDGLPLGSPDIDIPLTPGPRAPTLSYCVTSGPTEPEVVLGLVHRLAAATGSLAHRAWDHLVPAERARLAEHGVHDRSSIPDMTHVALQMAPVAYPPWDPAPPSPAEEPRILESGPAPATSPVHRMLTRLGVPSDDTTTSPEGAASFVLDDLACTVRPVGSEAVHLAVVIADDADKWAAFDFAFRHSVVGRGGSVQVRGSGDLRRLTFEAQGPVAAFGDPVAAARSLRFAWQGRGEGRSELTNGLTRAGIAVPHLGTAPDQIDCFATWHWGTRWLDPTSLYQFDVGLVAYHLRTAGHLFALSHGGHGVNSYGLSLVVSAGPVAAFVQHPWGGGHSDPVVDRIAVNTTYSRLHDLMVRGSERATESPRWLLVQSSLRGTTALIDLDCPPVEDQVAAQRAARLDEAELFAAVTNRLGP